MLGFGDDTGTSCHISSSGGEGGGEIVSGVQRRCQSVELSFWSPFIQNKRCSSSFSAFRYSSKLDEVLCYDILADNIKKH